MLQNLFKQSNGDAFQARQVNAISFALFIIFTVACLIVAISLNGRVSEAILGLITGIMILIGLYLMLFEGLKQKGALVIAPSSAVDTMNLGGPERSDGAGQVDGRGRTLMFHVKQEPPCST